MFWMKMKIKRLKRMTETKSLRSSIKNFNACVRVCMSVCMWIYDLAHLSVIIYYVLTTICSSFCKLATHIILWVWLQLSLRRHKSYCVASLYAVCRVSFVIVVSFCLFVAQMLFTYCEKENADEDKAKLVEAGGWENKRLWIWIECFCSRTTTTKYYTSCCCFCSLHLYEYATYFISYVVRLNASFKCFSMCFI